MFRFQSFHMYGVIGVAVVLGALVIMLFKKFNIHPIQGEGISYTHYPKSIPRYLIGGTIFGLGWAMTGACPGPMYVLVGNGITVFLVVIAGALLGTLSYGALRDKLPH